MALRNVARRRGQALAIALGLMVGTAIIAGSLATGDSMTSAIRESAIRAFGPVDETVGLEGRLDFPVRVADALARDPRVAAATDGIAPILLDDVAVGHARTRQWEPRAALVGLDAARDASLGPWATSQGTLAASALGPDEAMLNQRLADALGAGPGDTVTVRFAVRPEPLVPRLHLFNGTLAAGAGAPAPLPLPVPPAVPPPYATAPPGAASFEVPVEAGAVRVTAALFWGGPAPQDLDVGLQAPDGTWAFNANGTAGAPDAPAVLNASAQPGSWMAHVASKAAAAQDFTLAVLVFHPARDIAELQAFLEEVRARPEAQAMLERVAGPLRLESRNFTVRAVALEPGRGAFLNAPDVFVRMDVAQSMLGREGRANLLLVSNPGGAEEGLRGTPAAMAALDAALLDLRAADPEAAEGLRARPLKEEWVREAERAGGLFSSFLTMMGSFSILAGLILIGNIFVMLTEERRAELGIGRALGLRRADVTRLFAYEGALYAAGASALGAVLGLGVSFALLAGFNAAWGERIQLQLPFRPTPDALLVAFAAGVLMTLGAVLVASQRAARLNIVRSIRRLEEPDTPLGRVARAAGALMLAAGAPLSAWALAAGSFTGIILAPNLALLGAALLASTLTRRRAAVRLAAWVLLLYNLLTIYALDTPADTEGMVVGPLRGALMVIGAVTLLVESPWTVRASAALLARFRSLRPVARTALAYPLHRRLRTALTVVMFGLVLTVVVLFSIFFAMFTPRLAEQSGGFDVVAETTLPAQDMAERLAAASRAEPALAGVRAVASLEVAEVWGGKLVTVDGDPVRYHGPPVDYVYGFDDAFVTAQDFPVLELHPSFASAREAYEAALRDPRWVVVSRIYTNGEDGRPGAHHVGDTVAMKVPGGTLNLTIAAVQKQVYFGGLWVSKELVGARFDSLQGVHLLHLREGADASAVARAVEATQEDLGTDAASVAEEAERYLEQQRRLYVLFEVYLGLGLVLGIASLGVVAARSVLERRQEVGMLRAIGLPRAMVFRAFLAESLFVVSLGALVGLAIGLVVAWGVHGRTLRPLGIDFVVPWVDLALILGVAYAATLLATLGPARRAARLAPAEAIRYIE